MYRPRSTLEPIGTDELTVVPANEASWDDMRAIFGNRGYAASRECQRWKMGPLPVERRHRR